jgi:hypothetical protein
VLKLLFIFSMVAQISSAYASTDFKTKIKMIDGQLVIPDKTISVSLGVSRYDEDKVALQKVGQVTKIKRDFRQCVVFARDETGKNVSGYAFKNKVNSDSPEINAVLKTSEGNVGHLAVVTGITLSTITIREANFYGGWETERVLLKSDSKVEGYII